MLRKEGLLLFVPCWNCFNTFCVVIGEGGGGGVTSVSYPLPSRAVFAVYCRVLIGSRFVCGIPN